MAITAAKITNVNDIVIGNRRMHTRRLTFSGNYATGGEAITAANMGLRRVEQLLPQGSVAMATGVATAIPIGFDAANSKVTFYEGSAAGTALAEKTNSEVYPTGCFIDVTAIGTR